MESRSVEVETPDGRSDSFIAYPSEEGDFPGVLMGMDAFGPRPYLYEMARTLAAQGYFVLLPNFFYRTKRAPVTDKPFPLRPEDIPQVIRGFRPLVEAWTMDQRQVDATAYLKFLGQQKQVRAGKIGITGYCMGGVFALRTAAWFPDRVAAAASFHAGNLATDALDSPHRLLASVKAEIYVAHADHDPSLPPDQIAAFDRARLEAQVRGESELYAGALHGFTMRDLPAANETALERHWEKLTALFARTLR